MPDKLTSVSIAKTEEGSLELTEELIRVRAYHFYEERGCEDGHDLEDWLQAEAEIAGKKPAATAESETTKGTGKAAAA
jgi:hypothetical protein